MEFIVNLNENWNILRSAAVAERHLHSVLDAIGAMCSVQDDDDPERNHITRRALTKKEIEENDFRAYIANTSRGR